MSNNRNKMILFLAAGVCSAGVLAVVNRPLFFLLNGTWGPVADRLMLSITHLGNGAVIALVFLLLVPFRKDLCIRAILAVLLAGIFTTVGKELISSSRPVSVLGDGIFVLGPVLRGNSFPSGHTATVFAAAFSLRGRVPQWILYSALTLAALVGLSRIYIGVHFPMDVFFGSITGLIAALLVTGPGNDLSVRLEKRGPVSDSLLLTLAVVAGIWITWFEPMTSYNPWFLRPLGIGGGLLALILLAGTLIKPVRAS